MFRSCLIGATFVTALAASGGPDVRARGWNADVLIEWNQILQTTLPPGTSAIITPRYYAMMHIAMFDAVNSIEREYEPYRVPFRRWAGGSAEAAAAQAAHDVLTALIPAQTSTYDAALAQRLGNYPSGFVRRGASIGARVAREIVEWRQNDGWVAAPTAYVQPLLPGLWQPTPPNNPVAAFTHLQGAAPMALLTATQFLPPPPPTLTSETYATDLNEVQLIGKSDSAVRSAEQTEIALLWAGVATTGSPGTATNIFALWNNIVRDVARDRRLSLAEAARLFVLVNASIHDSLQTTQTSKFVYGLWRPVTAIRHADTDLNPATDPDPNWLALLVNPPYPAYGGNMAGVGASAARTLELVFGTNDIPIAATWRQTGGLPDVTHHFAGFRQAAQEQADSRIYGGIHFRFDSVASQNVGRKTAEFVAANFMAPRDTWGAW